MYNNIVRGRERRQLYPGTECTSSCRREHAVQVDTGDVPLPHINGIETDGTDGGHVDDITLTWLGRCKDTYYLRVTDSNLLDWIYS